MDSIRDTDNLNNGKFKKGVRVPGDAVGLSWSKSSKMTPQDNVIVIDTSNTTPENKNSKYSVKLMYANELGILEDEFGNQIISDEFPVIGDVFLTNNYKVEDVLPFVHVSKYFHIDKAGLVPGTSLSDAVDRIVRVVDSAGREYTNSDGARKYKICIANATQTITENSKIAAYRLNVFLDTDLNEDLYLEYNKCELDEDGAIVGQNINHKEIVNPLPYFLNTPEESDVVDFINSDEKLFSTKAINTKEQLIGLSKGFTNGFKAFVPKKAIPDSRIFQLFRWRLKCSFVGSYTVDPVRKPKVINCGVLVTNTQKNSDAPFAFYNLQRSTYNASKISFVNPLQEQDPTSTVQQTSREYWQVNLDSLLSLSGAAIESLKKFDVLLLCLPTQSFDLSKYSAVINYFTSTLGKTLIIETNNKTYYKNLGIDMTSGVNANGNNTVWGLPSGWADIRTQSFNADWSSSKDEIFNTLGTLGGWSFYDDDGLNEFKSLSPYYKGVAFANWSQIPLQGVHKTQRFTTALGTGFRELITAESNLPGDLRMPVLISKKQGTKGSIYASSCGIFSSVSQLFNPLTGKIQWYNANTEIIKTMPLTGLSYDSYLNTHNAEGAYKLLYNISLMAVRNNQLNNADEISYSSSWEVSTPWKQSWVIDAKDGVLSDAELVENNFSLLPVETGSSEMVWKRKLVGNKSVKQMIDELLTPEQKQMVSGTKRIYSLEVTNSNVDYTEDVSDESYLYAWTQAYTPGLEIPPDIGPYIIKDDNILGDYSDIQVSQINYPAKPFKAQVKATYGDTSQIAVVKTVHWTATATATKTTKVRKGSGTVDTILSWVKDGPNSFFTSSRSHEYNLSVPVGISTWQDENYLGSKYGPAPLNWPSFGLNARLDIGSTGEYVSFLQDALSGFALFGLITLPAGKLGVTGIYDERTKAAVLSVQDQLGARYVDGIVDAETWFLLGNLILRLGAFIKYNQPGYKRFYGWPAINMMKQNISNEIYSTGFIKRSAMKNSPKYIWDIFRIQLDDAYNIHGITVVPYLPGGSKDMLVTSVDVLNSPTTLKNYDPQKAKIKNLNLRPKNNQELYIPFGPYNGDTIFVGLAQDKPANASGFRELGVKDIVAHAKSPVGGGTVHQEEVTLNITGTALVRSPTTTFIKPVIPNQVGVTYSDITWTSVSLSGDESSGVYASIDPSGTIKLRQQLTENTNTTSDGPDGSRAILGRLLPKTNDMVYPAPVFGDYTMDTSGKLIPGLNTGYISKSDGIRLFCDAQKRPVGFPTLPSNITANEGQRHYSMLAVSPLNADPSVKIGFYDIKEKEFITSSNGISEISFIEYMTRGPQNIYVGVMCDYEELSTAPIPISYDAPQIPYKWIMPVYGLLTKGGSKIAVEPIKARYSYSDMWELPIKTGTFSRVVNIPNRQDVMYSGYLSNYQGRQVKAFYSVPEAENANWSSIYGRPNVDIIDENPEILDEYTLRVASAPILSIRKPTLEPDSADPMVPVFVVYTRESVESPWEKIPFSDISDYNLSTGEIILSNSLNSTDKSLVKVDYTTSSNLFNYKGTSGNKLFINPYLKYSKENIGKPIYIYMYPKHVEIYDNNNGWQIIEDSIRNKTIEWSMTPSKFSDPLDPLYDPLVVELAVVYVTNSVDIDDIELIDIRKRGGGLTDAIPNNKNNVLSDEYKNYWDINSGYGEPYQKGGFIIIRLPASLKERFPDSEDIHEVIRRNVPAGVGYKIEDTNGNNWE